MISTQVVAVKRADGTEEELARAGFCRLDATDDGRRQLYQDGEQPRAGVVRVSAALLQRCETLCGNQISGAPLDATCFRSCVCAMAWRFTKVT